MRVAAMRTRSTRHLTRKIPPSNGRCEVRETRRPHRRAGPRAPPPKPPPEDRGGAGRAAPWAGPAMTVPKPCLDVNHLKM